MGFGFEIVQDIGASGHRPGMPMFQQSARAENKRVLRVGRLVRGDDRGRDEPSALAWRRKPVGKDHIVAGMALVVAGIGHRSFAL